MKQVNKKLLALHLERGRLLERIAHQRTTLAMQLAPLQKMSASAGRVMVTARSGLAYIRSHPAGVAAVLSTLVMLRPRGTWRLLRRGLVIWRSWRTLRALIPEAIRSPLYKFIWQRYASR
jgi:YqjK-like protein